MDHVLGKMSKTSGWGLSLGTVRFANPDFAGGVLIFAETTEILWEVLEAMSEEAEPLALRVFWIHRPFSRERRNTTSQQLCLRPGTWFSVV